MFPLEYPLRVLRKHRHHSPVVLDPFCGRGTTIYAARELGLASWGIDSSPIAVAIAKAKLASADLDEILKLAERLIARRPKQIPESEFFNKAYHKQTLKELCGLREGLLSLRKETSVSTLLRAAALGCLHGPLNKGEQSYFSNQMPRTFAAKPDYALKFWKDRNLRAPKVSVLEVIKRKLIRIANLNRESGSSIDQIICGNSQSAELFINIPSDFSLVITSPPYYGMKTYIQDQWLRMWFLGGPDFVDYETNEEQLNHESQDKFIKSLSMVWDNLRRSKADNLHLYVRFGSVPSVKSDALQILRSSLEESGGWRVVYTQNASNANKGKRQAIQMVNNSQPVDEYDFHIERA